MPENDLQTRRTARSWGGEGATGAGATAPLPPDRLVSADFYRGAVMLLMMGELLRFSQVAKAFPESRFWQFLARHQTHVEWTGLTLHDLIQPSFSFLVGLGLAYSVAAREQRGESFRSQALHAGWRSLLLIAMGVWLRTAPNQPTNFTFEDTLSQIGLGYFPLFLLATVAWPWQAVAVVGLLLATFGAFALFPLPAESLDLTTVGVTPEFATQHNATGFLAHWNKNTNFAFAFDRWFLNLFPRPEPWQFNRGGYSTLNFVPTLATMLLGLLAGGWLRRSIAAWPKLLGLWGSGVALLGLGWAAEHYGVCPSVKRIWTPAWVLVSGGWCCLLLGLCYAILDWGGWRRWAWPVTLVGMNSIAAYFLAHGFESYLEARFNSHFGVGWPGFLGDPWKGLARGAILLLSLWLVLAWLYRRRIFIRV